MAVQVRSAGRGIVERVIVLVKSLKGITTMNDVVEVVPSAGTMFGSVAPMAKSGIDIELNITGGIARDSPRLSAHPEEIAKLNVKARKRLLPTSE